MTVADRIEALATRVGQELKALRLGKADDSAVVHLSGTESVSGTKVFGAPPQVPVGSMAYHPVRRDDARLSDARTPTAHAASHASNGSDPVTPAAIGAAAAGHSHDLSGYVPTSRQVSAGTGLTGGGTLAADRTLAVAYGTAAGTAAQGNDSRLSDARTPTAHGHAATDLTSGLIPTDRFPNVLHPVITASGTGNYTVDASLGTDWYLTATGNRTLTISGGTDGQMIVVDVLASGGARTITLSGVTLTTGLAASMAVTSGKVGTFGLRRTNGTWRLLAATQDQ